MKTLPFVIWAGFFTCFIVTPNFVDSASSGSIIKKNVIKSGSLASIPTSPTPFQSLKNSTGLGGSETGRRVKRGHGRSYTTRLAYSRVNDSGQGGRGEGHGGHGGEHGGRGGGARRNAIGEDGTHIGDFKSHGIGYEHKHGGQCEESKCGYNIRHCPHGCVFNSFTCGGGAAYDTCCC